MINRLNLFFKKYSYIIIILVFLFLIFVRNLAFWSAERVFFNGDINIYALHLSTFARNLGTIFNPKDSMFLWNPNYLTLGIPTLSIVDMGLFYPPNWIIVLLIKITGNLMLSLPLYMLSAIFHLFVGSIFVYKLLKKYFHLNYFPSLVGALIWIFLGFNTTFIGAAPVIMAATYLPISIYLILQWTENTTLKNYFIYFLSIALSFLVGYPMVSILVYLMSLFFQIIYKYPFSNKNLAISLVKSHFIGFATIVFPLLAPLYLSSFTNLSYTVRSSLSLEGFLSNAVSSGELVESVLLSKNIFTANVPATLYFFFSLVGIIILTQSDGKIFKDKKNIYLLIVGIIFLIFSFGKSTSLPIIAYLFFPLVNLFRRLSVMVIVPEFIFVLFVAQSLESALKNNSFSNSLLFLIKTVIFIALFAQALAILPLKLISENFTIIPLFNSISVFAIVITLTILSLWLHNLFPKFAKFLLIFTLIIEAGIIISSKTGLNYQINPQLFYGANPVIEKLQEIIKPGERVNVGATQYNYTTDYFNLEQYGGYLSLGSQYLNEINSVQSNENFDPTYLKNILGIKYIIKRGQQGDAQTTDGDIIINVPKTKNPYSQRFYSYNSPADQWQPDEPSTYYAIKSNKTAFNRIFIAHPEPAEQTSSVLTLLNNKDSNSVYVSQESYQDIATTLASAIDIITYKRNYLKALVKTDTDAFVANSTGYYPGWWVIVNGKWMKPIQTNWFMMGTYVPEGESIVEFVYIPYPLIAGLIYLLLMIIFWLIKTRFLKQFHV